MPIIQHFTTVVDWPENACLMEVYCLTFADTAFLLGTADISLREALPIGVKPIPVENQLCRTTSSMSLFVLYILYTLYFMHFHAISGHNSEYFEHFLKIMIVLSIASHT